MSLISTIGSLQNLDPTLASQPTLPFSWELSSLVPGKFWKSWAPLKCKFFLWLAINNWCWTANRLAKRRQPHQPACPFCDQAEETIQHILISCVFTQQVWTLVFQKLPMATLAPPADATRFFRWWDRGRTPSETPSKRFARGLIPLLFW